MSAGIVVTIVLCLIGLLKLPFGSFKEKHPQWYKSIFTLISAIIGLGLCVLDELYILSGDLISFEFITLVLAVMAGIFGGYNGVYEGLGVKELIKKLKENLNSAKKIAEGKKAEKYLDKYIKNVGDFEKAIQLIEERKNKNIEV